jgi:hypothetical protein
MISHISYEAITFNSISVVTECDDVEDGNFKIVKCMLLNVMRMVYCNNYTEVGKSVLRKGAAWRVYC